MEDLSNNTNTEFTQANKVPGSKLKEKGIALMCTYKTFFAKYWENLMKSTVRSWKDNNFLMSEFIIMKNQLYSYEIATEIRNY